MGSLSQDLRYALRSLAARPGFTVIAVIALALGIGANTAMFSVINGVVLKPLSFKDPDKLVKIWEKTNDFQKGSVAYPNFRDWRDQTQSFDKLAAYRSENFNLTGGTQPERVDGRLVSADLLSVLGVSPALGRDFLPEEDRTGSKLVALISNRLWQRHFGGDPSIVNKTITLNDDSYTVIGVLPESFHFYRDVDLYTTISAKKALWLDSRMMHPGLQVVGRLKPGVNMAQASAEMSAIAERLGELYPDTNKGHSATIGTLYEDIVGNIGKLLVTLLAAVAFVLLIACANVANLMLARAASRQREIAIRSALGASRFRIARLLIVESVLTAAIGGVLGLGMAFLGTGIAIKALPGVLPRAAEIKVDASVLAFTLIASVLTGLAFGLVPALQASRPDMNETLKEGGRSGAGTKQGVRSALVIAEIALALILLVGAGLLMRSVAALTKVNPGFDPKGVLSVQLSLSPGAYSEAAKIRSFYKELLENTRSIPGVRAATASALLPLDGDDSEIPFFITGRPAPSPSELPMAMNYLTTPGYLETMRIPLLKGRYFDQRDSEKTPMVAVIDENLEQDYFPGEDPVGKFITVQGGKEISISMQIVGVVGHVKQENLDTPSGSAIKTQLYMDFAQLPDQFLSVVGTGMGLLVRTDGDPVSYVPAIRSQLSAIDPNQPIYDARPMEGVVQGSIADRRFVLILLGAFSFLALVLASVGIYGVISYSVAQRTREIGVRMALGAGRGQVMSMVLANGGKLAAIGVGAGAIGAFEMTRFISAFLYGVSPTDPLTFAGISVVLCAVALFASYIPARRAMKVDPVLALRHD